MQIDPSIENNDLPGRQVAGLVLREAKKLHRAATSDSLANSLPVLRRLLSTQVFHGISLPELSRRRGDVQRKHVLRALAIEAGFPGWKEYRDALVGKEPKALLPFDVLRSRFGYPNLWFSSPEEAESHAAEHGGRTMQVGQQAVVFPER
tara:strand:+ start:9024 stop:9470 length:447 start_codon:yes stop_codon:yes gene_type:complete